MRTFGWAVALVTGGYAAYLLVRSIPDIGRYIRLSSM
jgi:hypothetical protein